MSGGSFEYLFAKVVEPDDAFGYEVAHNLQAMADSAAAEGYPDFALQLNELLAQIRIAQARVLGRANVLAPAMKAYEWWRSMDYTEEQFREVWGEM